MCETDLDELVHRAGDARAREEHYVTRAVSVGDPGVDRLGYELAGLDAETGGLRAREQWSGGGAFSGLEGAADGERRWTSGAGGCGVPEGL